MIDKKDFEKVNESIVTHLQLGEIDVCLSLMKTLRFTLDASPSLLDGELLNNLKQTTHHVKQLLLNKRNELDDDAYHNILELYTESLRAACSKPAPVAQKQPEETFLTTGQVAQKFGVSSQTILNMIHDGRIHAIRPHGTHYKIPASQFIEQDKNTERFRQAVEALHATIPVDITDEDLDDL